MVIFSLLLEKCGEEYHYRYISENITYYIPSYKTDRLDKTVRDYDEVEGYSYSQNLSGFLNNVYEKGEFSQTYTVKDEKNTRDLTIFISGYRYNNYIILVGTHKSDSFLEDTLFKENYIFLVRWVDSKDGFIDDISDNVTTLLGYAKEELLAKPYIELIHLEDRSNFKDGFNNFIKLGDNSFYQKYRLIDKKGVSVTVLDHSCLITRDNKKTVVGYLRDITKETQMSTELKELLHLDEANFNNVILMKIEWDKNYTITRWNTEAEDTLGWGEKIVGKNIREIDLFSDADSIKMQGQFKRLFAKEVDSVVSSHKLKKKDGSFIDTKWANKLITRNGEIKILSSIVDLSNEALLTNRLDEMESRTDLLLKTLSETKLSNDVFSKLIHNPLTANPEGLIKAEIIIRKLEEEITRLNDTIFHNNGKNLLTEVANLKYDTKDIREELTRVRESQTKVSSELNDLLNINILNLGKNLNFKNLTVLLVVSYIVFAQLLPGIYIQFIKPGVQQINKELKQIEGRKD